MLNLILSRITSIFETEFIAGDEKIIITPTAAIIVTAVALALGIFLSLIYIYTHKKSGYLASMPTTLIILPVVVSTVIMLVGTNYASAFALAGVFTLIRFRSEPGDPKDISYIFATVSAGLCCGMGFVVYAAIIGLVIGIILLAMYILE